MVAGIIGWVVVGVLVGFVSSKLVNLRGDDPKLGMIAAVLGAVVGAIVYRLASGVEVRGWNAHSLLAAAVGAAAATVLWHAIRSRTISHITHAPRRSR